MRLFCFLLVASFFCLQVSGCTVTTSKYAPILPTPKMISDINIGQIQTKTLGEAITTQTDKMELPGFISEKYLQLPLNGFYTPAVIPAGMKFAAMAQYENGMYYCEPDNDVYVKNLGQPGKLCFVIDSEGNLNGLAGCGHPEYSGKVKEFANIKFKSEAVLGKGSFRKELLYNGKSRDTIKLQYREYKDDFARPAFFQDLSYDLSESKIVGFKGMQIEIIEANNSIIRYKVLKQ